MKQKAKKAVLRGSPWWRCARYELVDGLIVPAPGSRLVRYDPWSASPRSYLSLFDLLPDPEKSLDEGMLDHSRLLAWCARHGLLGILFERLQVVTFPPSYHHKGKPGSQLIGSRQTQSFNVGGSWQSLRWANQYSPEKFDKLEAPGVHARPGVIVSGWGIPGAQANTLESGFLRYFPGLRAEDFDQVLDSSDPFSPKPAKTGYLAGYAEPFDEFLGAAVSLKRVASRLGTTDDWPEEWPSPEMCLEDLKQLMGSIAPALASRKKGEYRIEWAACSLLAILAWQVASDLTGEERLRTCAACGRLFRSAAWQATYCSTTCRNRIQKRTYRQELKKRKKRNARGRIPTARPH